MKFEKVPALEGVRVFSADVSLDTRGTTIKNRPNQDFIDPLDSILLSINPRIGTIRGLHFQTKPNAEEKLVTCVQGAVYDVVLDLRPDSSTFGKWASVELNRENNLSVYLPHGIAHGFQTLIPDSIIHYCITSTYSPDTSYSIKPIGEIAISWPIDDYIISDRDRDGISIEIGLKIYANSLKH